MFIGAASVFQTRAQVDTAASQPAVPALPEQSPRLEDVQAQRQSLTEAAGLSDQARQEAIAALDRAIESLKAAATLADDAARFERARQAAPGELEAARAEAAQPLESSIAVEDEATADQLRPRRDQAEANLALAQARAKSADDEIAQRAARRNEIPSLLAKAQQDFDTAKAAIAAMESQTTGDDPPEVLAARRTELLARRLRLADQIAALGRELASIDARADLLQAMRDGAARKAAALERQVKAWRDEVARREKQEAAQKAALAARALELQQPALSAVAKENVGLIEQLSGGPSSGSGLVTKRAAAESQLDEITKRLATLQDRFAREQRIGGVSDLAEVVDVRLRQIRQDLPDIKAHRSALAQRRRDFTFVQQQLADLEYRRAALPDVETSKAEAMESLDRSVPEGMRADIAAELDRLLRERQELYNTLITTYTAYAERLLKLQAQETALIDTATRFAAYIDERILWIRSMPPISTDDIPLAAGSLKYLASPRGWLDAAGTLLDDAKSRPEVIGAWVIFFLLLFIVKRRLALRLRTIAAQVRQVQSDRFLHTLNALVVTALLAAFWPAVLWFVAWRLNGREGYAESAEFNGIIAAGLGRAAIILLTLQAHRQLCKPNGLGEVHFRWLDSTRRLLNRNLAWMMGILPLSFLIEAVEADPADQAVPSLGRLAFMGAMVAVAVFTARILHPRHHIMDGVIKPEGDSWLYRLRHFIYLGVVGVPLALLVTAALGYYYTALQLEQRLVETFWLIQGAIIFGGLVLRWLLIARRKLAIEEARNRKTLQGEADGGAAAPGAADAAVVLQEPKIELHVINAQTRRLLRSAIVLMLILGSWAIWVDMLPALGILRRVEIYPHLRIVPDSNGSAFSSEPPPAANAPKAADAGTSGSPVAASAPPGPLATAASSLETSASTAHAAASADAGRVVTLSDLIRAGLILFITIGLGKNLPGLLEITILPRLPLDPSGRFAVSTIARYIVSIAGVIATFGALGVGWTQVQWLAAAISLGIGFGLQEIFANFISGIIVLFEQPLRVGDTVTINGVEGTVSRIRMRATTIIDFDRKEVIIPNKDLITGQIVNWTLSDTMHRLVFTLGVAYGSDHAAVEKAIRRVIEAHPLVLRTPAPQVVFARLGESSLEYSVRVFIASVDNGLTVRHELNRQLDEAMRQAGIELAFPQRDIHIRSISRGAKDADKS